MSNCNGGAELLTSNEAARRLGVTPGTLNQWRYRGEGPSYAKVGRCVRYSIYDLNAWLASRRIDPAGAEGVRS